MSRKRHKGSVEKWRLQRGGDLPCNKRQRRFSRSLTVTKSWQRLIGTRMTVSTALGWAQQTALLSAPLPSSSSGQSCVEKKKNKKKNKENTHWCSVFDIKMNQPPYKQSWSRVYKDDKLHNTYLQSSIWQKADFGRGQISPLHGCEQPCGCLFLFLFFFLISWKRITYQCIQVDVGPLNLLGLFVILDHGPA